MPSVKITERVLDTQAKASEAQKKPRYLWDTELRGFGCYVSGRKVSFLFQHWVGGKGGRPNRFVIGHRPTSVEDARKLAETYLGQAAGKAPVVSPKRQRIQLEREAKAAKRLKDAWDEYYLEYPWKSDSHKSTAKRYIEGLVIPSLQKDHGKDIAVRDVTQDDIIKIIKAKKKQHPIAARYVFRLLTPFFKYCIQERFRSDSPMYALSPPPPSDSRDRVLKEDEIKALWEATSGSDLYDSFHRLLLLTGQRRDEVSGMRWTEIDMRTGTWVIPSSRTKNKREHIVHLSDQALMILGTMPVLDSDYVFTTTLTSHITGYGRAKARLDKEMQSCEATHDAKASIPHWTLHDLRRTLITVCNEKRFADPHVIEAAVNHLTGVAKAGVAGVYNRAAYLDERRQLFNAWGEYVEGLVAEKPAQPMLANVLAFPAVAHR